jgi:hypothetical protein
VKKPAQRIKVFSQICESHRILGLSVICHLGHTLFVMMTNSGVSCDDDWENKNTIDLYAKKF